LHSGLQAFEMQGISTLFFLVAGYSWQACWLFECLWQLLFLVQSPVGMVACLVCLLGALASMLYALSRLYA